MRKPLLIILALVAIALAQGNAGRNAHGFRVPSSHTLGQGFIYFSGEYESVSDGEPLAMKGFSRNDGFWEKEMENDVPSSGGYIQASYGMMDFLELDVGIPFHYDGDIEASDLSGSGFGDMQIALKAEIPLDFPLHIGFNAELFLPTGAKSVGFRPRHAWYMQEEKKSYAFTYGDFAASGSLLLTLELFDIVMWNSTIGYLATFDNANDVLLWGSGLELFPKNLLSLILEVSGEIRTSQFGKASALWNEIFRMTPGLRLHLPYEIDILFGIDLGIDLFRKRSENQGYSVQRQDKDGVISYTVPGTPKIGFTFALSKTFDFSWKDSDRDGVPDRLDMCPNSSWGVLVNSRGCPVDEDQDGILNIFDDCPGTPYGVKVDYFGCPIDSDQDSVPDYQDKCPNTPAGFAVDETGCTKDTDNDGVDDNNDKCPATLPNDPVDSLGCPLDEDHDGVPNSTDRCPETPAGRSIDEFGCPLDEDRDGIPDDLDQCPNTEPNEKVDDNGCPSDADRDGIPDSKDLCADTPHGYTVDSHGCPTDKDSDGVPDAIDKCPNTPAKAPVDSAGCPLDSDSDGVPDYRDLCDRTFKGIAVDAQGCAIDRKMNLNNIAKEIKFKDNSDQLLNSSYTAINDAILLMRKFKFNLEIQCSATGANAKSLSEARARTLAKHLANKGFDEDKIQAKGFGATLPQGKEYKSWNSTGVRLIPIEVKEP